MKRSNIKVMGRVQTVFRDALGRFISPPKVKKASKKSKKK
jgi:hypothetical protein